MKRPLPLAVPLFLVAVMWLVFAGLAGWVYMQTHGAAPAGTGASLSGLQWDAAGFSRLAPKFQLAGLASLGVLVVLIVIGVRLGEKNTE